MTGVNKGLVYYTTISSLFNLTHGFASQDSPNIGGWRIHLETSDSWDENFSLPYREDNGYLSGFGGNDGFVVVGDPGFGGESNSLILGVPYFLWTNFDQFYGEVIIDGEILSWTGTGPRLRGWETDIRALSTPPSTWYYENIADGSVDTGLTFDLNTPHQWKFRYQYTEQDYNVETVRYQFFQDDVMGFETLTGPQQISSGFTIKVDGMDLNLFGGNIFGGSMKITNARFNLKPGLMP